MSELRDSKKWARYADGYMACPACGALVHPQYASLHANVCLLIDRHKDRVMAWVSVVNPANLHGCMVAIERALAYRDVHPDVRAELRERAATQTQQESEQ